MIDIDFDVLRSSEGLNEVDNVVVHGNAVLKIRPLAQKRNFEFEKVGNVE